MVYLDISAKYSKGLREFNLIGKVCNYKSQRAKCTW